MSTRETHEPEQAPDAIADRKISGVIAASLVVTLAALLIAWVLLAAWGQPPRRGAPKAAPTTIGILEQSLIRDTERGVALQRQQARELEQWGWVDRDAGIARIPIESAIDLIADAPPPADRAIEPKEAR